LKKKIILVQKNMQAIIVPTDFSPIAYNAAQYAIALAADLKATRLIIYNAFQPYIPEDPELSMAPLQIDINEFRALSMTGLLKMKEKLTPAIPSSLKVEYESEYNSAKMGIIDACEKYNAELIVMGISGTGTKLEESLIGSTAVDVSRISHKPVIIVPEDAVYKRIKKILMVVDFKKVEQTTPVEAIKKILDETNAHLDVLHVEVNDNDSEQALEKEKNLFDSFFTNYNVTYHFIKGDNFTDIVNAFAVGNKSDLIIVIPKKHSLFEQLFKRSHSKALAFHSDLPVLNIHG
jgi:nucleotide-binding universal stress UspA family protein